MLPINAITVQTTIPGGQALAPEADLGAGTLVGIAIPAAWTTAILTFQVSVDGGQTWNEMISATSGTAVQYNVAAGQYIAVDPTLWRGVNALRVRSGTSAAPVNQGASATLTLVCRPLI